MTDAATGTASLLRPAPLDRATGDRVVAEELATWGVPGAAAVVLTRAGVVGAAGDSTAVHPWASVSKVVAALAVLDVVRDGRLRLEDEAGPPGATVRHLLGHTSGLSFDDGRVLSEPGRRRIYSNTGIDIVVDEACRRSGAGSAAELLTTCVLVPLGMTGTRLVGPTAHGLEGPLDDLVRLAAELLEPRVLPAGWVDAAVAPTFPEAAGVLPGFGRQDPNDWGLGVELRGRKAPHWMPEGASPSAFGHFGQAGSFVWVDRPAGVACASLSGTPFGPWAAEAWPRSGARWLAAWAPAPSTGGGEQS
ncbi:MAG: serine hydrolase domain-containing protein [Candidatus Nanopelagicales bacterium]